MLNHILLLKMRFENAEAQDRYLPHWAHQELGRCMVAPVRDDVAIFGFDCSMPVQAIRDELPGRPDQGAAQIRMPCR